MNYYKNYEAVIGLEVHVELKTKSKIFCSCKTDFGALPNTQVCPVCMGMPGTLPVLNKTAVKYAVKAGLAVNCAVSKISGFDRKNYFYPDLPKGYQITQLETPICYDGFIDIDVPEGTKKIGITRIHLEEDAGKLIHDSSLGTLIDCNRCGIPLIEIVSEPDIRSAEEACAYLKKLRTLMLFAGISDCRMNEGSFRCDVNISVRKIGTAELGTRTEIKNLNSFQFVSKAIDFEYRRQVDALERGEYILQETRRFDESSGETHSMRKKENAHDYRYFPEPDLRKLVLTDQEIDEYKSELPLLPDELKNTFINRYGLTAYDSDILTESPELADYFIKAAASTEHPKLAANMLITDIMGNIGEEQNAVPVKFERLACISDMLGNGKINSSTAKKLIKELIINDFDVISYVKDKNLEQINDKAVLIDIMFRIIESNPKSVDDYKKGKTSALKSLIGQAMAQTGGRGNPVLINEIAIELLNK